MQVVPTDLALFQTLSPSFRELREILEAVEDAREEYIQKFSIELEKEIQSLIGQFVSVRNRAQDPLILSPSSKSDDVIRLVDVLIAEANELASFGARYEKYQTQFKLPITTYTEVAEIRNELNLKRTLWVGLQEWQSTVEKWRNCPFDSLVTEDM